MKNSEAKIKAKLMYASIIALTSFAVVEGLYAWAVTNLAIGILFALGIWLLMNGIWSRMYEATKR